MNRLPNVSQAACASQHATPVAIVPRVQVAPPLNEYARKMLLVVVFEMATRLLVLVGLTTTKLSSWLPAVALTFITGAEQASGTNKSVGTGTPYFVFMHLRVPSGTSMLSGPGIRACRAGVVGARKAKTAASAIRRRRVFIGVFLRQVAGRKADLLTAGFIWDPEIASSGVPAPKAFGVETSDDVISYES